MHTSCRWGTHGVPTQPGSAAAPDRLRWQPQGLWITRLGACTAWPGPYPMALLGCRLPWGGLRGVRRTLVKDRALVSQP